MNDSISWSELAELTHVTQLERFGFCFCEDSNAAYPDCPVLCGDHLQDVKECGCSL